MDQFCRPELCHRCFNCRCRHNCNPYCRCHCGKSESSCKTPCSQGGNPSQVLDAILASTSTTLNSINQQTTILNGYYADLNGQLNLILNNFGITPETVETVNTISETLNISPTAMNVNIPVVKSKSKVKNVIDINYTDITNEVNSNDAETGLIKSNDAQMAVYNSSEDDTVLVPYKTIFGNTKYKKQKIEKEDDEVENIE